MKKSFIIGADVSKLRVDFHCFGGEKTLQISNDPAGYRVLLKWIKKTTGDLKEAVVVMEYTGLYSYQLEKSLAQWGVDCVKRPALDIKRSAGIVRGKTDRADARMIARYGWQRKDELKPVKPLAETQLHLQQLMAHRDKLVSDRASYQCRLHELSHQIKDQLHQRITESTKIIMEVLEQQIKETKKAIQELIKQNEELQLNYELLNSIAGIGFATAVHVLIATENFSRFDEARKFACYSGVAPFENTSGSSIRGKTRVSHLANKKLKSLLTLAALSAKRKDLDLKAKFEQKVKEGKAKMCALNIIRFKLIERIFAVIKRQTPYILKQAA